ncbi:hypothetical protein [Sphingobium subterraneum]|uniref:Sensor c-di-GMP phosphodiesterase-like protein n=1 Tax=Sphingobium subterraneum TaxID=627688 RepID=A0A841IZ90_9SPHN|nr:hypothetical protein [Sphingobium subterraneum]MBB6122596.1 sensor c-di-GMP phosphodiesterase-like protein [Sphingobium subterraneum]
MKIKRSSSVFDSPRRRSSVRLPIIPIAVIVVVIALLMLLWSRGGEKPQTRVEKAIPAEKLGK